MSQLSIVEELGSQMGNFSALYTISLKTKHRIMFLDTWTAGKGLQLNLAFDNLPIDIISANTLTPEENVVHIYKLPYIIVDPGVFKLNQNVNYDFRGLFSSYRYWYPIRHKIFENFKFKNNYIEQANSLIYNLRSMNKDKEIVAVHVRRYPSRCYNLPMEYYKDAFSFFEQKKYAFIMFSDDIDWCKESFGNYKDLYYAPPNLQYIDMCAISLCDHCIVANSQFSMWGALLNRNVNKKIICPGLYDSELNCFSYTWFPDDWIPLDVA